MHTSTSAMLSKNMNIGSENVKAGTELVSVAVLRKPNFLV